MVPTLVPGDTFLVVTLGEPDPGEIAVCQNPADPDNMVVGRVIATAGSTFSIEGNVPRINGKRENRLTSETLIYVDDTSGEYLQYLVKVNREYVGGLNYLVAHMERTGDQDFKEIEIYDGVFLLGDNRNRSYDSRHFGEILAEDCIGTALFILWPGPDSGDILRKDRYFEWLL